MPQESTTRVLNGTHGASISRSGKTCHIKTAAGPWNPGAFVVRHRRCLTIVGCRFWQIRIHLFPGGTPPLCPGTRPEGLQPRLPDPRPPPPIFASCLHVRSVPTPRGVWEVSPPKAVLQTLRGPSTRAAAHRRAPRRFVVPASAGDTAPSPPDAGSLHTPRGVWEVSPPKAVLQTLRGPFTRAAAHRRAPSPLTHPLGTGRRLER
jgi:hypothetical protein